MTNTLPSLSEIDSRIEESLCLYIQNNRQTNEARILEIGLLYVLDGKYAIAQDVFAFASTPFTEYLIMRCQEKKTLLPSVREIFSPYFRDLPVDTASENTNDSNTNHVFFRRPGSSP